VVIVHLITGLPGSGKTTLAQQIQRESGAVRMCPDDWMQLAGIPLFDERARALIEQHQWVLGLDLAARGRDIIVEWGTWGANERTRIQREATAKGHAVHAYFLDPPLAELWRRVDRRNQLLGEQDQVPYEELARSSWLIEWPLATELADYAAVTSTRQ